MFEMMASLVLADHLAGETFSPSMGEPGYVRMLNPHRRPFKTLDGYLCVMIYTDRHWASFFKTLGEEAQFKADDRYRSMTTRTQHIEAIYGELSERLLTRTTAQWMELMREADVPAIPMHTLSSLIDDPHLAETGFLQTFEHPSEGRLRTIAYPTCWTQTQPGVTRPAPQLGEHTHEVLTEMGYSGDRIATLEQSQAIRCLKSA
jgi:crotonobetainyl-CoA:carnitine CoA-transferase CaiB-like acyl-CoA transferase